MSFSSDELPDGLLPFKNRLSPRFFEVRKSINKFIVEVILPSTPLYHQQKQEQKQNPAYSKNMLSAPEPSILNELRKEAQQRGLWNLFLPEKSGLSVLEYAPLAEILGAFSLANLAMNCSAPDTGNMELLEKFGNEEQKQRWLKPLLNGEIRSCFAMTEPGVASSDATNICTQITRTSDGKFYVVNGHKWWISGAIRPECKIAIVLGKTRTDGPSHSQQSMIIVPMDCEGVKILHPMQVMGHEGDHAEIIFENVRVPAENLIWGEGKGFEIAQGRLGPGRIHHCMRTIGVAEMALAAIVYRVKTRKAFGSLLAEKDTIRQTIAEARLQITETRQLCYLAAVMADEKGFKAAKNYIAMIKVAAPRMALKIVDEAIQIHGAHGISQYSRLGEMWRGLRTLRLADGPDVVHLNTIASSELSTEGSLLGRIVSGENKNVEKYQKFRHVKAAL